MTTFVYCRGCGEEIHETAPTCPKCGAPQLPVTVTGGADMAGFVSAPRGYSNVKWFRRRWFLICCMLTIAPIGGLVALTGETFYMAKGVVKIFPKNFKVSIYLLSVYWFYTLVTPVGSSAQLVYLLLSVVLSLVFGFKR